MHQGRTGLVASARGPRSSVWTRLVGKLEMGGSWSCVCLLDSSLFFPLWRFCSFHTLPLLISFQSTLADDGERHAALQDLLLRHVFAAETCLCCRDRRPCLCGACRGARRIGAYKFGIESCSLFLSCCQGLYLTFICVFFSSFFPRSMLGRCTCRSGCARALQSRQWLAKTRRVSFA